MQKKTLNIPICDIKIDEEYGSHLAQDFSVSIPYVKYVKRIDDIDPLTEYYADKEDQVSYFYYPNYNFIYCLTLLNINRTG